MTTNKPVKAFSVQVEEAGAIIFATSGVVARRRGANELDAEFEDVQSCCRAPWADQYAEQGWTWWARTAMTACTTRCRAD